MISREILKKIRQIEIRTNRIVTETLAGAAVCKTPAKRSPRKSLMNRPCRERVVDKQYRTQYRLTNLITI